MNSSVVNTKIYKQILHSVKNPSGGYAGYRFINQAVDATDAIKYGANKISLTAKEIASRAGSNTGKPPMTVSMDSISDSIKRVRDYERAMKAAQKAKTNTGKPPMTVSMDSISDSIKRVRDYERAMKAAQKAKTNTGKPPMTVSMDSISDSIKRVRDYERAMKAAQKAKTNPIEAVSNTVADTFRQITSQAPKIQYQNRQNQGSVIKSQDIINANNREPLKQRFVQNIAFRYNNSYTKGTGGLIKAQDTISYRNPMKSFVRTQMYLNGQNQGSVIKSQDIINDNNRELLKQRFVQNMTFRFNQEFNR